MRKVLFIVIGLFLFFSCGSENENTMYVKGSIKGLKKGTLYLQKQVDSIVISIDSVKVNGTQDFLLTDEVLNPEMYYLTLGKSNKKIPFFGEKDTISITSRLDKFVLKAKISGSENQDLLNKFYEIKDKFRDQNLDLIKGEFEARRSENQDSILMVQNKLKNLVRRKYLYTTNFAINNANFEVAPYIALTELNDATIKLLDTINNSLSEKVKKSKYGIQLNEFVETIKKNEKN
ncbi:MAG: DUF4369 domain-containing protein [Flavobacteriaceae bacterium]|nr:DUF4369 domain-containing protein [Flavobacteriaceae bacterium]